VPFKAKKRKTRTVADDGEKKNAAATPAATPGAEKGGEPSFHHLITYNI
jgi:hypothetical protein